MKYLSAVCTVFVRLVGVCCLTLSLHTTVYADEQSANRFFSQALVAIDQGKWNEAEDRLLDLLRIHPYDPVALNNLAWVYFQKKQPEQGRQVLFVAMQTNPVYQSIYTNIDNLRQYDASADYNILLNNSKPAPTPNIRLLRKQAPNELLASNKAEADALLALHVEVNRLIQENQAKKQAAIEARRRAEAEKKRKQQLAAQRKRQERQQRLAAAQASQNQRDNGGTRVPSSGDAPLNEIRSALRGWARAWSSGDVDAYLNHYSPEFTPNGLTLAAWKRQRRARIYPKRNIRVTYRNTVIHFVNKGKTLATTRFTQTYRSRTYKSTNKKQLTWQKLPNGIWKIIKEISIA